MGEGHAGGGGALRGGYPGFPTWILADGQKFEGEKTPAELAKPGPARGTGSGGAADKGRLVWDASSQLDSFPSQ